MWNWLYGRPAQNMNVSGSMVYAHAVWRPLAFLSDEEVALLDELAKKLTAPATPVLDASPNAPLNQIESNTAIEVEAVESGA